MASVCIRNFCLGHTLGTVPSVGMAWPCISPSAFYEMSGCEPSGPGALDDYLARRSAAGQVTGRNGKYLKFTGISIHITDREYSSYASSHVEVDFCCFVNVCKFISLIFFTVSGKSSLHRH